jgi:cobalt/nickel transport system permease protein
MSAALRDRKVPSSAISRWDARWKLAGLSLVVTVIVTLRSNVVLGVGLSLVTLLVLLGRLSFSTVLQRWGFLWLSLLPVVLVLGITVDQGWLLSLAIVLRTTAIAGLVLVLVLTTSAATLCAAAQRLGVPGVLVQVLALAWRYARLFLAELQRIRIALFCRSFRMNTNGHTFRTLGYTAGTLMIRGADRSDRVTEAMLARGFRGQYHNLHEFRTTRWDVAGFVLLLVAFSGLIVWDRLA